MCMYGSLRELSNKCAEQGETSKDTQPDKDSDGSKKSKETPVKKKLGKCCIPFNQ